MALCNKPLFVRSLCDNRKDIRRIKFNELAKQFIEFFERLLNGEKIELFENKLCELFPTIAQNLIDYPLRFDYLSYITSKIGKSRQIIFEGNIISEEDFGEWNNRVESFKAIVTDKRITKQGIWIKIWVGDYKGERNLFKIFG